MAATLTLGDMMRLSYSFWCGLLCLVLLYGVVACSSGDEEIDDGVTAIVEGGYRGEIQDSVAGRGTVIATLAQNADAISGAWQTIFQNAVNNNGGTLLGTVSGDDVSITFTPSTSTRCVFVLTATASGAEISGNYAPVDCAQTVTGTLTMRRQQQSQ
jgi:hypothetical protein